ncbi:zinc finger Y-chromosomal protein 1-like [Halictus rubicundus]|uniref:zinc finger Y-chromosomal protein 1-like n=1 Tax=Halictus rubicundus TaxID=77578 RepID=UPI004036B731
MIVSSDDGPEERRFREYAKMRFFMTGVTEDRRRSRGQGRFACDNCDRRYHQMKNLRRHVINECGKQPMHQCAFCPYRATYKSYLQVHMMKHARQGFTPRTAPRPVVADLIKICHVPYRKTVCHVHSPRQKKKKKKKKEAYLLFLLSPINRSILQVEQYPSTSVFKHTCGTCGKTYKHKHHLKRHHDFECGIDPKFKCAFCPHRTRYKNSLMKHILARHQHLLDQNAQYGPQQVLDVHGEIQATMFASYHDFTQNL